MRMGHTTAQGDADCAIKAPIVHLVVAFMLKSFTWFFCLLLEMDLKAKDS